MYVLHFLNVEVLGLPDGAPRLKRTGNQQAETDLALESIPKPGNDILLMN